MAVFLEGMFYFLLLIFTINTFVLGYHWFSYGTSRNTSMIALATYLLGGAILFITLASSLALV